MWGRRAEGVQMPTRSWLEVLLAPVVSGVGVSAAMLGETGDAPGLTGVGGLLVADAVGMGVHAGRRSARPVRT